MGFNIKTPKIQRVKIGKMDGTLTFHSSMTRRVDGNLQQAQRFIDSEVLRHCKPLVPFLSGTLIKSGDLNTKIGSGEVNYKTPYARKIYYTAKSKGSRGRLWFERMKASKKRDILSGAQKIINGG